MSVFGNENVWHQDSELFPLRFIQSFKNLLTLFPKTAESSIYQFQGFHTVSKLTFTCERQEMNWPFYSQDKQNLIGGDQKEHFQVLIVEITGWTLRTN